MAKLDLKRGDVVIVDLRGAEGTEKNGKRPCVVIQIDVGNAHSPMTIIVPITDQLQHKFLPVQVPVSVADAPILSKDSVVECGHIRVIDRDLRIEKIIGSFSGDVMKLIDKAVAVSVGL
jgi:mRNA interferase MazF